MARASGGRTAARRDGIRAGAGAYIPAGKRGAGPFLYGRQPHATLPTLLAIIGGVMEGKLNGWPGRILAGVIVLSAAGIAGATLNNTTRLGAIDANRFTSKDGLEVWQAIADIRADMASIPREVPPAWFIQRVDRIDEALLRITVRLEDLEDP